MLQAEYISISALTVVMRCRWAVNLHIHPGKTLHLLQSEHHYGSLLDSGIAYV